ncbi:MAG: hypothetical protein KDN18_20025, partial [Verrucomicrobiae bacterium]|nr:hypothetical protein [Verrucomicrobiae bacterium]
MIGAELIVTSSADSGEGSLREAIAMAQEGDTILLDPTQDDDPALTMTVRLTSGPLVIDKSITIFGIAQGRHVTVFVEQTGNGRVFEVNGDVNVTLSGLGVTGGSGVDGTVGAPDGENGGGLLNNGATVRIDFCEFTNNSAGYAHAESDTYASGSRGGNGGAIHNTANGSLTVNVCTFENNKAGAGESGGDGGAISSDSGLVEVTDTTFTGNFAGNSSTGISGNGGGIACHGGTIDVRGAAFRENATGKSSFLSERIGSGGATYLRDGMVMIVNCTVSGNRTESGGEGGNGGGVHLESGSANIINSTITGNTAGSGTISNGVGGGISAEPAVTFLLLRNSIVAGNFSTDPPESPDLGLATGISTFIRVFTSVALSGEPTLSPGTPNADGNHAGTSNSPLDPQLDELADNGGPTLTHRPRAGSPVIDPVNGNPTSFYTTDQRGLPRPAGASTDFGAVEIQPGEFNSAGGNSAQITATKRLINKVKKQLKNSKGSKTKKLRGKLKKLK